jgi:spore maturation protein CgeB
MKFVLFYHSLVSDWNHGNAHFLRGFASELLARGHQVRIFEPAEGWSMRNLLAQEGRAAIEYFASQFPELSSERYSFDELDFERVLQGADVAIVHEWNEPRLIRRVGECVAHSQTRAFFHDTHHRSVTEPAAMAALDLRHYEGVLAFGQSIADRYLRAGWAKLAWVWHEAADVRRFHARPEQPRAGDLVWIGNWGDEERSAELHEFLIEPVAKLGLRAKVYGVRYPVEAVRALAAAGIEYGGWLPNWSVPDVFAQYGCTVHVPRRAYVEALAGIPTIRMFEALACGIPLVCAPWNDSEKLFRPGTDYLVARNGAEMCEHLRNVLSDAELARNLAAHGRQTIMRRHTCAHRVEQLLQILEGLEHAAHVIPPRHAGEAARA